jgi:arylsulfatase A-like enzyme
VIFIADDQGENDLGCYGNTVVRTPHIDRLASEGMRFTHAYLTISSCSPSRSSILTGRYPHNTGAEDLHQPLPADQRTIARYLKDAGYYCGCVGKWHLGDEEKRHWDAVVECGGAETETEAVQIINSLPNNGEPFFLWVASKDPHRPFQLDTIPQPHDPQQVIVPPYLPDDPKIRKELALYYDEITRFDQCVGGVCRALAVGGHLDDTVVFYLSDNGMPFPRAKTTLYDAGIHTPLIVRWPGRIAPGSVQNGLASAVDIAPTVLAIAGIDQTTMQGRDLTPMLTDATASGRTAVFAEANWHDYEKFTRAVRTKRYKLIRNYYWDKPLWNSVDSINSITWQGMLEMKDAGRLTEAQAFLFQKPRPFEEFYDLDKDPYELNNIVDDPVYGQSLAQLRTLLDNWRVDTNDRMPDRRVPDGWTPDGNPLPHNQPWYDRWLQQGKKNQFETY